MVVEFKAVVSKVLDGDTIKIYPVTRDDTLFKAATVKAKTDNSGNYTVRLANIDAPEKTQPFGFDSKLALSDLLPTGSIITVELLKGITYGRLIGEIFNDKGRNINKLMVQKGCAYVYDEYFHGDGDYEILQSQAKQSNKGVWRLSPEQREKPQDYRKRVKSHKKTKSTTSKTRKRKIILPLPPSYDYNSDYQDNNNNDLSLARG